MNYFSLILFEFLIAATTNSDLLIGLSVQKSVGSTYRWLVTRLWYPYCIGHYNDVIMGAIASQITSLTIVYSIVYSDADQRKHQSSASLVFVQGIHRGPVNSPHKWPVTRKMFPFHDVIMQWGYRKHAKDVDVENAEAFSRNQLPQSYWWHSTVCLLYGFGRHLVWWVYYFANVIVNTKLIKNFSCEYSLKYFLLRMSFITTKTSLPTSMH